MRGRDVGPDEATIEREFNLLRKYNTFNARSETLASSAMTKP
jgi:hypothetical protein